MLRLGLRDLEQTVIDKSAPGLQIYSFNEILVLESMLVLEHEHVQQVLDAKAMLRLKASNVGQLLVTETVLSPELGDLSANLLAQRTFELRSPEQTSVVVTVLARKLSNFSNSFGIEAMLSCESCNLNKVRVRQTVKRLELPDLQE